jgi:hypothetical protein
MGTTPTTLKKFVTDPTMRKSIGTLVGMVWTLQAFIDYLQQCPVAQVQIVEGIGDDVKKKVEKINTDMENHFRQAQKDAGKVAVDVAAMIDIVSKARTFARHAKIVMKDIYEEAKKYQSNPDGYNSENMIDQLTVMLEQIENFQKAVKQNSDTGVKNHDLLNQDISNMNGDIQKMQATIPIKDAPLLNINNISQEDAYKALTKQIKKLDGEISDLQEEITWETVGQIGTGVVGGTIAIANWWNPVGWCFAGGVIAGEIELTKDKAEKMMKLNSDQEQLALTKEEQELLKPAYTIKNYVGQLSTLVKQINDINKGLDVMKADFQSAYDDVDAFMKDATDKETDELESEYNFVIDDYDQIIKDAEVLVGKSPSTITFDPSKIKFTAKTA